MYIDLGFDIFFGLGEIMNMIISSMNLKFV